MSDHQLAMPIGDGGGQQYAAILRRAVVLRARQRALHSAKRRTVEYARLLTEVKTLEAELDDALQHVALSLIHG